MAQGVALVGEANLTDAAFKLGAAVELTDLVGVVKTSDVPD